MNNRSEKLQKVLARTGIASRRTIEKWIAEGRISVNGHPAKLGDRIDLNAQVKIDDKLVDINTQSNKCLRVLLYHKPEGEICTRHDPENRPTVFEHLPTLTTGRWISVGRLDYNTSGLLLLTTDGELANQLMHPSSDIEREYAVRIYGDVDQEMLNRLKTGVMLEDGLAHFNQLESHGGKGKNQWYTVVLKEGRNRLVRRLWESQGVKINKLIRTRFGNIVLPKSLAVREFIELDSAQTLKKLCSK